MPSSFPWDYLENCTLTSLHSFTTAQRALAATLRKALLAEAERMIEAMVNAEMATVIIENSEKLSRIIELRQNSFRFEAAMRANSVLPSQEDIEQLSPSHVRGRPGPIYGVRNRMKRSA